MEPPELTKVGFFPLLRSQEGFPGEVTFELRMKGYVDGSRQQREGRAVRSCRCKGSVARGRLERMKD